MQDTPNVLIVDDSVDGPKKVREALTELTVNKEDSIKVEIGTIDTPYFEESAPISEEAWRKLGPNTDTAGISKEEATALYAGPEVADRSPKAQKFVALYKARTIISHLGTMQERMSAKKQLKRMKDLGLDSI